jgi:sugar phosphate isomerase/epimerase
MRLGLCTYSYQHLFAGAPDMFVDRTSPQFDWRGLPRPYFLDTGPTVRPESLELWQIDRAHRLGAPVVECPITVWEDANLERVKEALSANGQELVPSLGADLLATGADLEREIAAIVEAIERYAAFGGVSLAKACVYPMVHNRFRSDPPLREQLDRLIAALPPVAAAAEKAGIVLAWENHLDYRAHEVVEIIEGVGSPHLRFLFDMGNPFPVCEDPLEAARVAAPYVVLAHVKDIVVLPWTPSSPGYLAAMYACPLGEGNVPLRAIVEVLRDEAPDPETLPLALEASHGPPNTDEDRWVQEGADWMRANLSDVLATL